MIPLTFLYGEYIAQPKFSEQKKPFEYIVPAPTSGVGTKSFDISFFCGNFQTETFYPKTIESVHVTLYSNRSNAFLWRLPSSSLSRGQTLKMKSLLSIEKEQKKVMQ